MSNKKLSSLEGLVFSALEDAAPYIQNYDWLKGKIVKCLEQVSGIQRFKDLLMENVKKEDVLVKADVKIYLNYLSKYSAERR